jgi:hypothetical protein
MSKDVKNENQLSKLYIDSMPRPGPYKSPHARAAEKEYQKTIQTARGVTQEELDKHCPEGIDIQGVPRSWTPFRPVCGRCGNRHIEGKPPVSKPVSK